MIAGIYVGENKTMSEDIGPGSNYWRRLAIDIQTDTYIEGARSRGYDVLGVLFNVLRKPALQPYQATPLELRKFTKATKTEPARLYANQHLTDELPSDFMKRCLAAICEDPSRYYARRVISRLAADTREAAFDRWNTGIQIRDARRLNIWPRNSDACVQWSRACDYIGVCSGEQDLLDPMLFAKEENVHSELGSSDLTFLTQSSMRAYRSCPRKYQNRYERGSRPLGAKAKPLRVGTGAHGGIEVLWGGGTLEAAIVASQLPDEPYESARVEAMLVGYVARWSDEPPMRIVAVEQEFDTPLVNPETGASSKTWRLAGKCDAIIQVMEA